jgi:transcriptional regulator with XRE-family HTH domain
MLSPATDQEHGTQILVFQVLKLGRPPMIFRQMETETWFNAQLLKSIRKDLGWTQLELAERTNLSVRVIAKAEAGTGIANRTVRMLVETLRKAGKDVSCDDFECDPRAKVQRFLQNCNTYKKDAISRSKGLLARSILVYMDGNPINNPLAGTYQGVEEFEALLHKYHDIFVRDGGTLGDLTQMRAIGQEVIAWGHEYIRVPEAPPSLPSFTMLHIHFKDGLIARIDNYYEAAGMMSRIDVWSKMYPHARWLKYFDLAAISIGQRPRSLPHLGHLSM